MNRTEIVSPDPSLAPDTPADTGGQQDGAGVSNNVSPKIWGVVCLSALVIPWVSQPPLAFWPAGFAAVIPYLVAATLPANKKQYWQLYLAAFVYWALTLQGLRHAHPVMYACWLALAVYLAVYRILFVIAVRRIAEQKVPLCVAVPVLWVGMECIRNYLLTGVSAAMLGHTMADIPWMIQVADLGGSYAVSFVVAAVNVALFEIFRHRVPRVGKIGETVPADRRRARSAIALALITLVMTFAYGRYRLGQPTEEPTTTFALIGRAEKVEYFQGQERELEIFDNYIAQSVEAVKRHGPVDVVVWPESMFTGTLPWLVGSGTEATARELDFTPEQFSDALNQRRQEYQYRAASFQYLLAEAAGGVDNENLLLESAPDLLVGCGVVDYRTGQNAHSGLVHIGRRGVVEQWYAKNHLVMFGEYVPLVTSIPIIGDWVPEEIGLTPGKGPEFFSVRDTSVSPNICIETAIERVTINHLRELRQTHSIPESIVTVTNDAWFDDSSVVQHHKRAAQFVAIACRRPILSAANNGPTCWIDSRGSIVEEIEQGEHGTVIATPRIDDRISPVMLLGDWPARIGALVFVGVLMWRKRS